MKHILLIPFFLLACIGPKKQVNYSGRYTTTGLDFQFDLILNRDSSFLFKQKFTEFETSCIGKWKVVLDTLILNCNPEDKLSVKFERGYMIERVNKLIIGKKELKFENVTLIRKKESD
jgi:hypothetical protein